MDPKSSTTTDRTGEHNARVADYIAAGKVARGYAVVGIGRGKTVHAATGIVRGHGGFNHPRPLCQPSSSLTFASCLGNPDAEVTCRRCLAGLAKRAVEPAPAPAPSKTDEELEVAERLAEWTRLVAEREANAAKRRNHGTTSDARRKVEERDSRIGRALFDLSDEGRLTLELEAARRAVIEADEELGRLAEYAVLDRFNDLRKISGHDYGAGQRAKELKRRERELEGTAMTRALETFAPGSVARYWPEGWGDRYPEVLVPIPAAALRAAFERIGRTRLQRLEREGYRSATISTIRTRSTWLRLDAELELRELELREQELAPVDAEAKRGAARWLARELVERSAEEREPIDVNLDVGVDEAGVEAALAEVYATGERVGWRRPIRVYSRDGGRELAGWEPGLDLPEERA